MPNRQNGSSALPTSRVSNARPRGVSTTSTAHSNVHSATRTVAKSIRVSGQTRSTTKTEAIPKRPPRPRVSAQESSREHALPASTVPSEEISPKTSSLYEEAISRPYSPDKEPWMHGNPLRGVIHDDAYRTLLELGVLNEKSLRDHHIRMVFRELREIHGTNEAIEHLQHIYPYLQFDTLRKIVYQLGGRKGRSSDK